MEPSKFKRSTCPSYLFLFTEKSLNIDDVRVFDVYFTGLVFFLPMIVNP